ncbi:pentatricopeptide repeat-containing protein At3g57430, chloroplastic-like [Wolffia australiana]
MGYGMNSYDYAGLLRGCASLRRLRQIHGRIAAAGLAANPFLAAKLVSLYAALSPAAALDARRAFDGAAAHDTVLWNVLIRAVPSDDAISAYVTMRRAAAAAPNGFTFTFLLASCSGGAAGAAVHAEACKRGLAADLHVGNALAALYSRAGDVAAALRQFEEMPARDVVSWNTIIAGAAKGGRWGAALGLLGRMQAAGVPPDYVTLVAALPACAKLAAARAGLWAHAAAVTRGLPADSALGGALVTMYAACGRLGPAREVFDRIPEPSVAACGAMMGAYGAHGLAREALALLERMPRPGPDGICFLSLLSACAHAGLVEEGKRIWEKMEEMGVERWPGHYGCMAGLLARAGCLREAAEMAASAAGAEGWRAVMGACGEAAAAAVATRVVEIEPGCGGGYVALARAWEGAGGAEAAARVRTMMRDRGVRRTPGRSWVEVEGLLHGFGVADESHPNNWDIYGVLHSLGKTIRLDDDDDDDDDGDGGHLWASSLQD